MNYYNDNEPHAAEWLRVLIDAGELPPGDVDDRSISDVKPSDLDGYTQCHFFAGIGGWPYALALAGFPPERPVWTGSCPCQPYSAAGKGKGNADERHLWPDWFHLIDTCGPETVMGEQVSGSGSAPWVELVSADMEGRDYAFWTVTAPAAGFGAPQIRHRRYFVGVADADNHGCEPWHGRESFRTQSDVEHGSGIIGVADANNAGRQGRGILSERSGEFTAGSRCVDDKWNSATHGLWRSPDWIFCRDDKWRPIEPGTVALVDGFPGRVDLLRGYGNAINAPEAAAFIRSVM